jgi:hypothetical protein
MINRNTVALEILKAIISADWKFVLVEGAEKWDDKAIERAYELADAFVAYTQKKETEQ